MKAAYARNSVFVLVAIVSAIAISVGLGNRTSAVTACGAGGITCPYIKTFGADVFAGGWFANNCAANYQNYLYGSPPDANYGGISAYAKTNSNKAAGGASSQYGAFALGNIDGSATNGGFYGGGSQAGSLSVGYLNFANTTNAPWGGEFEGAGGNQGYCIPDYFTSKQTNTNNGALAGGNSLADVNSLGSANYYKDTASGTFTIGGGTLDPNKNIAIFVKGNVYISGDITYAAHNPTNVPKFALVVQGNIYIAPGVSQLTGWYIAQPAASGTPSTNDGVVWTCYDINTPSNASSGPWLEANCANKLTLNGAVVAKYVNFRRVNGDIGSASTSEDTLSNALGSNNISEIINYTPDMVIGGPFFNAGSSYNLDSLVSLPPVF